MWILRSNQKVSVTSPVKVVQEMIAIPVASRKMRAVDQSISCDI